jgi:hypothetical protein
MRTQRHTLHPFACWNFCEQLAHSRPPLAERTVALGKEIMRNYRESTGDRRSSKCFQSVALPLWQPNPEIGGCKLLPLSLVSSCENRVRGYHGFDSVLREQLKN